jgi:hypothetical protein
MAFIVMKDRGFTVTETQDDIHKLITSDLDFFYVNEKTTTYGEYTAKEHTTHRSVLIRKDYIMRVEP